MEYKKEPTIGYYYPNHTDSNRENSQIQFIIDIVFLISILIFKILSFLKYVLWRLSYSPPVIKRLWSKMTNSLTLFAPNWRRDGSLRADILRGI